MKTFRLVATVLLVALCAAFYSCSGDGEEEYLSEIPTDVATFIKYGITDYADIEMRNYRKYDQQIDLMGLRNNHLWLASFDVDTKQKLIEWTDNNSFDRERRIDLGYGEHKDVTLSFMFPEYNYITSNNSFIAVLGYQFDTLIEKYAIFKNDSKAKHVILKGIRNIQLYKGYKDSYFIGNCCYTQTGDTIYVVEESIDPINNILSSTMVSYEENIAVSHEKGVYVTRKYYKTGESVWNVKINKLADTPSNTRISITILDNSTNIWKYKIDLLYYDGTKKDYTFSINVDNGELYGD